jgi:hypothetical protein
MKTAMMELIDKLSMKSGDSFYALVFYHDNDEIIKEALEKEKEQIIYDYMNGKYYHQYEDITAEEYYNNNYGE